MKTIAFKLTIIFLLLSMMLYSNTEKISLNLEEGNTYVFETKTKHFSIDQNDYKILENIQKRKIEFAIEKVTSDKITISSLISQNVYEKFGDKIKTITDYKFPAVVENINYNNIFQIALSALSNIELKFEINLKNNSVLQTNREEMFEEISSMLEEKGYNSNNVSKAIELVKKDFFFSEFSSHNNLLLYLNQAIRYGSDVIESTYLKKKYSAKNNIAFSHSTKKINAGNSFEKLEIDSDHGFISKYYCSGYDSIESNFSNSSLIFYEKEYSFLYSYKSKNSFVTFNCTIQNPRDSIITIFYLDKPYGVNYSSYFLTLNKDKSTSFQVDIHGQSFLLFSDKKLEYSPGYVKYFFYVEPGDTIDLRISNVGSYQKIDISGNRKEINRVLANIQENNKLFRQENYNVIGGNIPPKSQENVKSSLEILNTYIKENDIHIENRIYTFLKNEFLAKQYLNYYSLLRLEDWINLSGSEDSSRVNKARTMISDFDIHDIYNDYGIFSRKLSRSYLDYYLNKLPRINDANMYKQKDIVQELSNAKLILGGSVYYREIASRIVDCLISKPFLTSNSYKYDVRDFLPLINKLSMQTYNKEFAASLNEFKKRRLNWEDNLYIPQIEVFQQDGNKINLETFIKGKPTVIYYTKDWSRERYYFDAMAEKYPEIRFVLLVEGNNLREWMDYLDKAEPVAGQLFSLSKTQILGDIFVNSNRIYISYDKNGALLGYDVKPEEAIQLAKESLIEKKETDKSTLQLIILILGIVLVLFTITALIWRWRVRQRFKAEEQKRKLRELELTAIRSQMNPHFLFNSLNSVQNLIQQNKGREVHLYLAEFAGLIRKVLHNSEKEEISLAEELEMVKQYLSLEKLRFEFNFVIHVDEEIDSYNTLIPSMLLQPFAENAVVHGLQFKPGIKNDVTKNNASFSNNGRIEIRVSRVKESILISIEDNGVGRKKAEKISVSTNGKGTKMIEQRLKILQEKQGEKYQLEIIDLEGKEKSGTRVQILIPEEV